MSNDSKALFDTPPLPQRCRASTDFLAAMAHTSFVLRAQVFNELEDSGAAEKLSHDQSPAERANIAETALRESDALIWHDLLQQWRLDAHGLIAQAGFDDMFPVIEKTLADFETGPATLHRDPEFSPPPYWENVNFHCTTGGWDGHPYMGYIHGEIVHKIMVNKMFSGDIFAQRRQIAELAPKSAYPEILEMGASTGHYTQALQETYPQAHISGIDLSIRGLEHAQRVANKEGYDWDLYQRSAADTRFETGQFDLATSYILLHELPGKIVAEVFKEAFRVLKPGGDLVFSDVARFHNLPPVEAWWADYFARMGGEPHWRASAQLDFTQLAQDAGFTEINERGLSPSDYPHVIIARKPR